MSQLRVFLITLTALLALGFLWGYFQQTQTTLEPSWQVDAARIAAQTRSERELRQMQYEAVWKIDPGGAIPIYGGAVFKVDPFRGHVYVADYGDFKIKEFAADGRPVRMYGEGKGQGPGQFVSLTDFAITREGDLWVVDSSAGRITIFGSDGREKRLIKSDLQPYRVAVQPDGRSFASMLNSVDDRLFGTFDAEGQLRGRFGNLLEDQARLFIALDGYLESGEDAFYYAGRYAGILGSWKLDGTPRFLVRTLDGRPLPKLITNQNSLRLDPTAIGSTLALTFDQGKLFATTYRLEGLTNKGVIDVYSPENGEYLYSMNIPESGTGVRVAGGDVYVLSEKMTITRWRIVGPA